MKATEAFINVTLFSYMACLFLTLIGMPPVLNYSATLQGIGYLLAMVIIIVSIRMKKTIVRNFCGASYGFMAMITFSGGIQWVGGMGAGLAMALWDLCLGVTIMMSEIGN